jgi:DNA polymerase
MLTVLLDGPADAAGWRRAARRLDALRLPPGDVLWRIAGEGGDLFGGQDLDAQSLAAVEPGDDSLGEAAGPAVRAALVEGGDVPGRRIARELSQLLDQMLLHADPERFGLAYRLLHRTRVAPHLLEIASDPDVARAQLMAKAVRRDQHKMKAFVRFRAVAGPDGEVMVAWFEPDHHITASVAPFFMRRFATMRWSILTPEASAHWDLEALAIGPGATRADAPDADALEQHWRTYYASIFNPARLKIGAMKKEMPVRYWRNLPEAELIKPLIRGAEARVREMQARALTPSRSAPTGEDDMETLLGLPESDRAELATLADLKPALDGCRRCSLHACATQGVPGHGPHRADIMFVGEQPGDQEDLAGLPFVGPAGKLFDIALQRSGIDRATTYVSNAVKHFKFEPRGKRRIHQKPSTSEIDACRWWLDREVKLVQPKLIVALGATGAFGVTGKAIPVQQSRGVVISGEDWPSDPKRPGVGHAGNRRPDLLVTVHPSFLLRLQTEDDKRREWHAFLADLKRVKDGYCA